MRRLIKRFQIFLIILIGLTELQAKTVYWNTGRGYEPFNYSTSQGLLMDNPSDTLIYDYYPLDTITSNIKLQFRSKNLHGNPSKKYKYTTGSGKRLSTQNPHWGIFVTSVNDTLIITFKGGEKITVNESEPCMNIILYRFPGKPESLSLTKEVDPYEGENLWKLNIENKVLSLFGGNKGTVPILETTGIDHITGLGFIAGWADKLLISDISLEYEILTAEKKTKYSSEVLEEYLENSVDEMEGYYVLFDRDLEEDLLKLGGDYKLACVRNGENYNFLYIEGGMVNSGNWQQGDIKAVFSPTPFEDIFEVEWLDAMKEPMGKEIKAQRGDGDTLLIQFPYQSSKLRLRKLPDQ